MTVFLKREGSLLAPVFPYLEASGEFSLASFGEERIPMGELWIDACFDLFAPPDATAIYRFFAEVHSVLDQWKASKVRMLLPPYINSSEPQIKKNSLLIETFAGYFEKAYGVLPLTVPPLLEKSSFHPATQIIQAMKEKSPLTLLWQEGASFRVMKALHCAELFFSELPSEACGFAGRMCTLEEIENTSAMLWGKAKIYFEDAYTIEEKYQPITLLGEEEEPLERLLFGLIN